MTLKIQHVVGLLVGGIVAVTLLITTIYYFLFSIIAWNILMTQWHIVIRVFFSSLCVPSVIVADILFVVGFEDIIEWFHKKVEELNY